MGRILLLELSPPRRRVLQAMLTLEGHQVTVSTDGKAAPEAIGSPDLVLLGCTSGDPHRLCSQLKAMDRLVPVLLLLEGTEGRERAWQAGADEVLFWPLPRRELLARVNSLLQFRRLNQELVEGERVLLALAGAIEAQEPYAWGHTQKALYHALALGNRVGLSAEELRDLRIGAILHDVGKVGTSAAILLKGEPLSPAEWEEVRAHPGVGASIARPLGPRVEEVVLHHHERWDGKGYPRHLAGEAIPYLARIMAIADALAAMTSPRAYRQALSLEEARQDLRRESGRQFDPNLMEAFLSLDLSLPRSRRRSSPLRQR